MYKYLLRSLCSCPDQFLNDGAKQAILVKSRCNVFQNSPHPHSHARTYVLADISNDLQKFDDSDLALPTTMR